MFCEKCGTQVMQGEKFCRSCGNPVSNSNVPSQQGGSIQPNVPTVKFNPPSRANQPYINSPVTQKKTKKQKKPINKKALIPIIIGVVAVIAVIAVGAFAINSYVKAAPSREMKKALESKDINQIMSVFDKYDGKNTGFNAGKLTYPIEEYVESAIDTFNNNFEFNPNGAFEESDIQGEILRFMSENFGTIFYVDGAKSQLWNLEDYVWYYHAGISLGGYTAGEEPKEETENMTLEKELEKLNSMINSKIAYYYGLNFLENPYDSEDYCNAIEKFNEVIADDTKYSDAIAKSGEAFDAYFSEILNSADEYIADGDYASAMELLEDALEGLSESEEYSEAIVAKTDEIRKNYASQYAQKAEEYFKAGDIDAAIGNIEAAISIDPEGGYDAKLSEYKMYLPLALYDENNILREEEGTGYGSYSVYKGATSNDNKDFTNVVVVNVANNESAPLDMARVHYNLAGKYDTVDGTIFVEEGSKSDVFSGYFEAYGDGKLLFTSPKMTAGVLPQKFSFSVSGVQDLEIRYCGAWVEDHFFNPSYCIANFEARKSVPQ